MKFLIFVSIVIEITNSSGRSVFIYPTTTRTHNLIIIRNKHTHTRDGRKVVCIFGRFGFPSQFFFLGSFVDVARVRNIPHGQVDATLSRFGCVSYQQSWWPLVHGASV